MKHGKKYNASAKLVDRARLYDIEEALDLAVKTKLAKFDETVEVHVRLGVDSRHADQQVRGAVVLPNGTGKKVRVLAFAKGDDAKAAESAGAEYVGAEDMVEKIQKEGFMDFDVVVATQLRFGNDQEHFGRVHNVVGSIVGVIVRKMAEFTATEHGHRSSRRLSPGEDTRAAVVGTVHGLQFRTGAHAVSGPQRTAGVG